MARLKAWLLRPINDQSAPWKPWYDKCFGMVVVAADEEHARRIASENCDDEGKCAWSDVNLSTCVPLPIAQPGVVIKDVAQA